MSLTASAKVRKRLLPPFEDVDLGLLGDERTVQRFKALGALLAAHDHQSTLAPLVLDEQASEPSPFLAETRELVPGNPLSLDLLGQAVHLALSKATKVSPVACPQVKQLTEARSTQPILVEMRFEDDPLDLGQQLVRDPLRRAETLDELLRQVLDTRCVVIEGGFGGRSDSEAPPSPQARATLLPAR